MNENAQIKFPDQHGYFDHRRTVQVFARFDVPTIYTFLSKENDLYFAYQYDEEFESQVEGEGLSTWLFIPTDQVKIKKLTQGIVTLREFFRLSFYGYLVTMRGNKIEKQEPRKYEDFPTEYLPEEGVKLQRNTSDLVITVNKEGLNPLSTSDKLLTELLTDFRKAMKKIMRGLKEYCNDRFEICNVIPNYALTGINWGSLELTLTPIVKNELFDASLDTIQKVVLNPNDSEISEEIRVLVKTSLYIIAPKSRGKYNFNSIKFSTGPASDSVQNITFVLSSTETELYEKEIALNRQKIKLTGKIRGFDIEDDFFRLVQIEPNNFDIGEIKCNFEQELLETLGLDDKPWNSLMNKKVTVECEYIPKSKSANVISIIGVEVNPT